ncbi:hypothetical protein [Pseudomonas sp. B14-6]|uniref:hypothetical protein n=1 Tax=Pseudomonas sp. B14-6 TaxID=2738843 RepID=UPI0021146D08|nr:hypothetical protein [Pseudomonas sp. B14-6]
MAARHIAYLRKTPEDALEPLITRQRHDVIGQLVEQRDPRLADALKPNLATVYGLAGQPVMVDSVDTGWRISLPGLAGEILQRWDARGSHWRTVYDEQLRPVAIDENDQPNVEIFSYADAGADKAFNLCGQLISQVDPSGTVEWLSFGLQGQALNDSRTITGAGTFPSHRTYSPLGALLTQTDAGDHRQRMVYDRAGQLQQVQLRLTPAEAWQSVLEDARYNAAGQIIEQHAGNKVLSTWAYDDADGRLTTLKAGVPGQGLLQHFQYAYDRVGNVLCIDDLTFKPVYFANQIIDGHRGFIYDTLERLICANGRDAAPSTGLPGRPSPTDPDHLLNYTQKYEYDEGNNLIKQVHERAVGNYTQQMRIDPTSNRGVRWTPGTPSRCSTPCSTPTATYTPRPPEGPWTGTAAMNWPERCWLNVTTAATIPKSFATARACGCSSAMNGKPRPSPTFNKCCTCQGWKSAPATMAKRCTSSPCRGAVAACVACIGSATNRTASNRISCATPSTTSWVHASWNWTRPPG